MFFSLTVLHTAKSPNEAVWVKKFAWLPICVQVDTNTKTGTEKRRYVWLNWYEVRKCLRGSVLLPDVYLDYRAIGSERFFAKYVWYED